MLVDTLKMLVERLQVCKWLVLLFMSCHVFIILHVLHELQESNAELHRQALVALKDQIRSSTATMASIPKAMKFLQPHYETLFDVYQILKGSVEKASTHDVM